MGSDVLTYALEERGDCGIPKYEQLYRRIKEDILSGALRAGEGLPSKRALAEHLGVSVVTVETAYGLLTAEGYAVSRPRSGFFVSELALPQRAAAPAERGEEEETALPERREGTEEGQASSSAVFPASAWARIIRRVTADCGAKLLDRPPNLGAAELRRALSGYLARYRGMRAEPERIVIGAGAEYLYGLVAQLFGPGESFAVEDPCYEKIRQVYRAHGILCCPLPMDRDGVSTRALASCEAALLHVTPFNSYPSGVTAPAKKRYEYIAWAHLRGGWLVEDDFDSEFSLGRKPLETLYAMDRGGRVIYLNTFSKSLAPGMRLGYMILPDPLLERFREKLGFYSCTVPAFDQYVLARFLDEGGFERHLNRVRRRLRQSGAERG